MLKLNSLMQKEMTRKEFLVTLGFGMAALFGLSALMHLVTGKENPLGQNKSVGYGSSTYGGIRKT